MITHELKLSKHLKVFVSGNGDVINAIDYRPAWDSWGDCTMSVIWNRELMKIVDEEFAKIPPEGRNGPFVA